jgi:hypothetical protein
MECTKDFIPLTESEWDDALWDPAFVRKLEKCDFFGAGKNGSGKSYGTVEDTIASAE